MKKEYKNTTVYIRESHNEEYPFTVVSNHLVNDDRLNVTDKGIMLMILSNSDSYVLNVTYLQKESGIGKVLFNKSMKKLQELGYLLKKPIRNGGYKWIVMESTLIYDDLQKLGYLKYDNDKSSWIIDEKMEKSLQRFDFHRKSENRNPETGKPGNQKPVNQNTENRIPDSQPLISTNETSTNIGIRKKGEIEIGISNNETLVDDIQILEISSEIEIEDVDLETPIQNSLPILFEKSEGLQTAFQNSSLTVDDFKLCSDSYIANVFLSIKLEKKDSYWAESLKYTNYNPKHYGVYAIAGRSALEVDFETELKSQLISQSKKSGKELHKFIYGF